MSSDELFNHEVLTELDTGLQVVRLIPKITEGVTWGGPVIQELRPNEIPNPF